MTGLYSEENRRLVDTFLDDSYFRQMVESELGGKPIRVTVKWEEGTVSVQGPKLGKLIQIQDILDAANGTLLQ